MQPRTSRVTAARKAVLQKLNLRGQLEGRRCPCCRHTKAAGRPFYFRCLVRLPAKMINDLALRWDEGFEDAYREAIEYLKDRG